MHTDGTAFGSRVKGIIMSSPLLLVNDFTSYRDDYHSAAGGSGIPSHNNWNHRVVVSFLMTTYYCCIWAIANCRQKHHNLQHVSTRHTCMPLIERKTEPMVRIYNCARETLPGSLTDTSLLWNRVPYQKRVRTTNVWEVQTV